MILDVRGQSIMDTFMEIRQAYSESFGGAEEILVYVDADDNERLNKVKGFIENCMSCRVQIEESNGCCILKIGRECLAVA